ncbi:MAG: deaminase [Hyphomicrobiales bacterium]|nr:MAG: deaminase [Hyphomicrobiales bacterium]
MRPIRYSINITLDGCCDHRAGIPNASTHRHAAAGVAGADALLFGRITCQMMEDGWRPLARGQRADWVEDWMVPFAQTIDRAKKYIVSDTLSSSDWNADIVRGRDLEATVRDLKQQPGSYIATGGVTLPLALARLGLIDEYDIVVHPRLAGHGPYLLAGLAAHVDLQLAGRTELDGGIVALHYVPRLS